MQSASAQSTAVSPSSSLPLPQLVSQVIGRARQSESRQSGLLSQSLSALSLQKDSVACTKPPLPPHLQAPRLQTCPCAPHWAPAQSGSAQSVIASPSSS